MAMFVEDWEASYGSAYLVTQDDAGSASAELVEDGPDLLAHDGVLPVSGDGVIAFVDGFEGVRRRYGRRTRRGDRAAASPGGMRAVPSSPMVRAPHSARAGYSG